jgi:hypothetical protein
MTETKYFTREDAQKTLPLVRKIVQDILATTKGIRLLAEDIEGRIEDDPVILKMVRQVDGFLRELEEIGCQYKDWNFTIGLVDFPAIINGEEVLLCWRSDEEEIKYYHNYEDGYAGRKPIPLEYFSN